MNKTFLRICSIAMATALISTSFAGCKKKEEFDKKDDVTTTVAAEVETTEVAPLGDGINPLTGEKTLTADAQGKRPIAIMVENSPAARPQWGISTPDIVVEGLVEGGITRMMWIYADPASMPEKVGPVRSARHDYVEIADGMNAIYAHCGGSYIADDYMSKIGIDHINQMWAPEGFKRDSSRKAPHNLTTSKDGMNIATASKNKDQTKLNWAPFTFADDVRVSFGDKSGQSSVVEVTFSSSYKHTFQYNADEKLYTNYMNKDVMKDGNNGEAMKLTNVIVMYAPVKQADNEGHMDWEMTQGDALYFSYGYGERITYKKAGPREPLKFYGKDGKLLTVNPGKTWIGVIPVANREATDVK